jgi:hypothetical protein
MAAIRFRRAPRIVIAVGFSTVIFAGCNSAPPALQRADYSATLNKYYEGRPMCLWPEAVKFPALDATPDDITDRGFAALTDAGLLVRKPASKHAPNGSATFDLSPEGRSAFDRDISDPGAGNFCYGRRKVINIDRDKNNSPTTELIDYHYNVVDPAAWVKEYSIERAFPQVVSELAAPHKAEVTLLDTTAGWEVSGTPAVIPTNNIAPKGSTLAKAKVLFGIRKQPS